MATTVQSQQNNPQLKRLVYSKYRELLGSYNAKANSIIQSLPSYMVTEDRGFHFDENDTEHDEVDHKSDYGAPPAPTLQGSIPSQRLPSHVTPGYEPPACVQNAMMTKDKKPFTYTPGGIDLSQIKSPRMAKRIARNAQYEGVTGPVKPSPLAQPNTTQQNTPSSVAIGAQASGMPFQVIPNGPPPPPPQPASKGAAPPPPPPPSQANRNHLTPQTNGVDNAARRSPTPQNFEPPPLGCRPEIKIPPNPMATLKRVPRPREKNDFWIEEYRKERSASPMVNNNVEQNGTNYGQPPEQNHREQSPNNLPSQPIVLHQAQYTNNGQQQTQLKRSPSPPSSPRQYNVQPNYQPAHIKQTNGSGSPQNRIENPFHARDSSNFQRPVSPIRTNQSYPTQQHQPQPTASEQKIHPIHVRSHSQPQPQTTSSPPVQKNAQVGSIYIPPVPQENLNINRQAQAPQSPPQQQQPSSPSLQQHLQQQQQRFNQANTSPTPRWMAPKPQSKEIPEWVRDDVNSSPPSSPIRHVQAPESPLVYKQPTQSPVYQAQQMPPQAYTNNNVSSPSSNTTSLRIQVTPKTTAAASNAKERIIPIQLEQTPTPTRTPGTPNFGPQPFYSVNQQYGSVPSPNSGYSSPNGGYNSPNQAAGRNPNQFVDQGYNDIPVRWSNQQRVTNNSRPSPNQQQSPASPQSNSSTARIIPIAIEGRENYNNCYFNGNTNNQNAPFNPNSVRGPISAAPLVIQNDPRSAQAQNLRGGQPNQSKSFRILQKLTDTEDNKNAINGEQSSATTISSSASQLQRPHYARQMSGDPSEQMRKLQLNDSDQAFMNRVRNQVDDGQYLHNEEDPRYRGSAIPSKSFKYLQSILDENSTSNSNAPGQRTQPSRYIQQRQDYEQNEQPQPYIHPSEQQVPEPKKYTGSAIPSRSFKILQAMTATDAAAEMEGSDVIEYKEIAPCQYPYPPPPYPTYWPLPPPQFYSTIDTNNWHYPSPYPIPHPYLYPCYHHPDYDSQNFCYYPPYMYPDYSTTFNNNTIKTPNIIVTNCSSDEEKSTNESLSNSEEHSGPIDALSQKLNELHKPEIDLNISQDDKKYVGDCNKEIQDDNISNISPVSTEKSSEIENCSDNSSDDDSSESTSEDTSSKTQSIDLKRKEIINNNDRLQAIKSVTDINIYDTDEESEERKNSPMNYRKISEMIFDKTTDKDSIIDEEYHSDGHQLESSVSTCSFCYKHECHEKCAEHEEYSDTDLIESEEFTDDTEEVEMLQMLSIIYEESEHEEKERAESQTSTIVSESTTIANDSHSQSDEDNNTETLEIESKNENVSIKKDKSNKEDDENASLVTVRLPLKLSFSRSSNDENITTVVVGDSEIEDERSTASCASTKSSDPKEDNNEADVSVTISLPSKRSSSYDVDKKCSNNNLVPSSLINDDSDSEVSVSFSLPMKRNKFMKKTVMGDVSNDISCKPQLESRLSLDEINSNLKENNCIKESNSFEYLTVRGNEDRYKKRRDRLLKVHSIHTEDEADEIEDEEVECDKGKGYEKYIPSKILTEKDYNTKGINEEVVNQKIFKKQSESSDDESKEDNEFVENINLNLKSSTKQPNIQATVINDEIKEEYEIEEIEEENSEEESESSTENNILEKVRDEKEALRKNEVENLDPTIENHYCEDVKENTTEARNDTIDFIPQATSENDEIKVSVRDRIAAFEATTEIIENRRKSMDHLEVSKKKYLNRNGSVQKSESEIEEDDSGVTSDLSNKRISETDDDSESFPELRKMTPYQRAATHSRLFKLLQGESSLDENQEIENESKLSEVQKNNEFTFKPSRKKIIHNVSITRRTNPEIIKDAETMSERRERLSLPLKTSTSIDADNLSTPNSPISPVAPIKSTSPVISDKLVNELVQSLLLKKKSQHLKNMSMEKLQSAARKVLEESFDSLENTSLDSTPSLTPQDIKISENKAHSYNDYYESWNMNKQNPSSSSPSSTEDQQNNSNFEILPSKAFRSLQEQSLTGKRKLWAAKCPRILSSKIVNHDLAKVNEMRETPDHQIRSSSVVPQSTNRNSIIDRIDNKSRRGSSLSRFSGDF